MSNWEKWIVFISAAVMAMAALGYSQVVARGQDIKTGPATPWTDQTTSTTGMRSDVSIIGMPGNYKCFTGDGSPAPCYSLPFDVAPKEWDRTLNDFTHDKAFRRVYGDCFITVHSLNSIAQVPCDPIKQHMRSCADKSRFLLMSEDGKWHCLALGKP